MREYFTSGSVRGAAGNGGPYRDRRTAHLKADSYFANGAKSRLPSAPDTPA